MSHYKTILVHLPDARRAERLLAFASRLAVAHDAHLIGLFVMPAQVLAPAFGVGRGYLEAGLKAIRAQADAIQAIFEQTAQGLQLKKEWRLVDPGHRPAEEVVMAHVRTADLVIVSQRDSSWDDSLLLEKPEDIVMASGRPTIVVPNAGNIDHVGKRITVAWNDRREAARATFDALPMLQRADNVRLLWINPENEAINEGDLPTAEIAATLSRHGVKCVASSVSGADNGVGELLLNELRKDASDMLVMGAFGHTRLREMVFGGATRYVFKNLHVPVLLSH